MDAGQSFCYLTTTGRRTGTPHTIEIWFAVRGTTMYLMSGGRDGADWVKNIRADPRVRVGVGDETYEGVARVLAEATDEDALARRLMLEKYQPAGSDELRSWGRSALAVAVDVEGGRA